MKFEISFYNDFISSDLADFLMNSAKPVVDVPHLMEVGTGGGIETTASLHFLCDLYRELEAELKKILTQRVVDRKFIDERVKACHEFNTYLKHDFVSSEYKTIIGLEDAFGRVVIGPLTSDYCRSRMDKPVAPIPQFLQGPHVTLFGPPDSAKMAINAMNSYHRKIKNEPPVIEKLLQIQNLNKNFTIKPKWGADDEDSKTPLRTSLVESANNLSDCFEGTLSFSENSKKYELAHENLAIPIKRFPGLALPSTFLFYKKNPIPLHMYDFALHLFKHWNNPQALVFYVPKLENEEEAKYLHRLISLAEAKIKVQHPEYALGTVRLMIVLENPRAILRTHEIMDELYPYFAGASLGWHDYLASTARLFKEDSNYRIPVKADPDIVIKYIKASHHLLSDVVGSRGGIKVGGMYGILPLDSDPNSESFQITLKGYIKDVITQLKRNLTGFWVAHPDFVRLGLALVEAWKLHKEGKPEFLIEYIKSLLQTKHHLEILNFIENPDIEGLNQADSQYVRSLLVANIKESDYRANNDPEEIRYNIFQTLQYLTDWLCGNGCVALPAEINGVPVRVMDDLATAERSRWEVWHEIHHGRFSLDEFLKIAFEEFNAIRKNIQKSDKKIIQVNWNESTQKWYPVAFRLMIQLMTQDKPVEFITELLLPFTVEAIRSVDEPLQKIKSIDPKKFELDAYTERFIKYFEICGCSRFASEMSNLLAFDIEQAQKIMMSFSKAEIIEASAFHGNIGEDKKSLDKFALDEQKLVEIGRIEIQKKLQEMGDLYLKKFGMKFLVSAKSKTGEELLDVLTKRLLLTENEEIENAKFALWEISSKRFDEKSLENPRGWLLKEKIEKLRTHYGVQNVSLAINNSKFSFLKQNKNIQKLAFGEKESELWFELASLSKTLATAFALEFFNEKNISLDTSVNELLSKTVSKFKLSSNRVTLRHLMSHSALNMHYVKGYSLQEPKPNFYEVLPEIKVICEPGEEFHYSGGGFILLEYIVEILEKKSIQNITKEFTKSFRELSFEQLNLPGVSYASGYFDDGSMVAGTRLIFPAFAAGSMGTAWGVANFLNQLTKAYHQIEGSGKISHDTAIQMLSGSDKGAREFMGCDMGIGIFVVEAGDNKLAIHQGANEGFRSLFVHCFQGPDRGYGFVILCNADEKGVLFISEVAQLIIKDLNLSGVDFSRLKNKILLDNDLNEALTSTSAATLNENKVNKSYKSLIFDAFLPSMPEEIALKGPIDHLAPYNLLTLSTINKVSNQKFARAENMISSFLPVYDPQLFGKQGKIMDSWESARHNPAGFDFVELSLAKPSVIRYVSLSTKFHDGNQAEFIRILAKQDSKTSEAVTSWVEILPKQNMCGHSFFNTKLTPSKEIYSQIRIEMFPDGGLTRVGLYDELPLNESIKFSMNTSERYSVEVPKVTKPLVMKYEPTALGIKKNKEKARINLTGLAFGARLLSTSNEHYGPAVQLLSPYPALNMFDGFESARSRKKDNYEEIIVQLAEVSKISTIILDFEFFINNNPREISIYALFETIWQPLVFKRNVKAYAGNVIKFDISNELKFSQIKINIFPDGGINRLYVFAD